MWVLGWYKIFYIIGYNLDKNGKAVCIRLVSQLLAGVPARMSLHCVNATLCHPFMYARQDAVVCPAYWIECTACLQALHDAMAATANFPPASMHAFLGAHAELHHGPRDAPGGAAQAALARLLASVRRHASVHEVGLFARAAELTSVLAVAAASSSLGKPGRYRT